MRTVIKHCKITGCKGLGYKKPSGTRVYSRGYCQKHYMRYLRHKDPLKVLSKFGESRLNHPLYVTYYRMVRRCTYEKDDGYNAYGALGITVCKRWLGINGFTNFVEDMGVKPNGTTLDRIDNSKGYSKNNCRWATQHMQAANKRNSNKTVGVCWSEKSKMWRAYLMINKKVVLNGYFDVESDAIDARKDAEKKFSIVI